MVLSCPSSNFSPQGIILCPAYLLVRGSVCGPRLWGSFFREFMVGLPATVDSPPVPPHARVYFAPGGLPSSTLFIVQCLFTLVTPRCSFHSCKTHHPFLSMVINCEADNMYTTKIKPFSLTFQHLTNPSLVVLISLFPSRDMYHLSRDIKGECPAFPLSIACFPWRSCPDTTIPLMDCLNQSL